MICCYHSTGSMRKPRRAAVVLVHAEIAMYPACRVPADYDRSVNTAMVICQMTLHAWLTSMSLA